MVFIFSFSHLKYFKVVQVFKNIGAKRSSLMVFLSTILIRVSMSLMPMASGRWSVWQRWDDFRSFRDSTDLPEVNKTAQSPILFSGWEGIRSLEESRSATLQMNSTKCNSLPVGPPTSRGSLPLYKNWVMVYTSPQHTFTIYEWVWVPVNPTFCCFYQLYDSPHLCCLD